MDLLNFSLLLKIINSNYYFAFFLFFILGSIVGSFINVCIGRLPGGESIVYPASHCPNCGSKLGVLDLFPIISWIFLKGKCRYCKVAISFTYPIVELLSGLLLAGLFFKYGLSLPFFYSYILVVLLLIATFTDIKRQIIPDEVNFLGTAFAVLVGILFYLAKVHLPFMGSGLNALAGAIVGWLFFKSIVVLSNGGMGLGDVKFAMMIGAFLGPVGFFKAMFLSFLIGGIFGLVVITFNLKGRRDYIPFGPFMAIGTILYLFGVSWII